MIDNSSEYSILIAGTSGSGEDYQKNYKIYLSNIVEDMDGDGIEDHYDLDDDGDGFSGLIQIAYSSDPKDPDSVANVAPHPINLRATYLSQRIYRLDHKLPPLVQPMMTAIRTSPILPQKLSKNLSLYYGWTQTIHRPSLPDGKT